MILSGLAALLKGIVFVALAFFPSWTIPTGSPGFAALAAANIVIPLDTWAMLAGATITAMGAAGLVWVIKTAFNAIRGSGA